jgi:hypothetical protein
MDHVGYIMSFGNDEAKSPGKFRSLICQFSAKMSETEANYSEFFVEPLTLFSTAPYIV